MSGGGRARVDSGDFGGAADAVGQTRGIGKRLVDVFGIEFRGDNQ